MEAFDLKCGSIGKYFKYLPQINRVTNIDTEQIYLAKQKPVLTPSDIIAGDAYYVEKLKIERKVNRKRRVKTTLN